MKNILDEIKKQISILQEKYPKAKYEMLLNEPATEKDFENLENIIWYKLSEEFKELYRIHNWSEDYSFLAWEEWLSIDGIISEFNVWNDLFKGWDFKEDDWTEFGCEPDEWIKSDFWWNPKWLPLTADWWWNWAMIDFDPDEKWIYWQILFMDHESPDRELLSKSLKEYFKDFLEDLEKWKYVLNEDYWLILKEDLTEDELKDL